MGDPTCPYCGSQLEDPSTADPPYDDAQDHTRCTDCKGTGKDPVIPTTACVACDGSGWT